MILSLVAAMANDRVIGRENDMPWHLPADLKHFKAVTLGKPVVMGRKTFESIGRPLPGRRNLVISRQQGYKPTGVEVFTSLQDALAACADMEEVMVIGGGQIYQQALPLAARLYLTFIDAQLDGDTRFPDWQQNNCWKKVQESHFLADLDNQYNLTFVTFERT
ncbi:type 3 dihydrofolate reductase [Gallaecimonas xiamenensis]|uniref:Dihydrofolate reductase n=1 Tax=Gallaecimonas xiamenensis 3-C-1 TaxID=745411 RepID=K2KEL2_9GAMM|nr:type 3 dihydrofolate reductase [Gallaecimonas xiamenensis]EKE75745.1 dihydrofolate reductase type I, trimethoprim resistance [Gallaecimonas xiamenensis 3-C-1]